jgi:hypothetical protein
MLGLDLKLANLPGGQAGLHNNQRSATTRKIRVEFLEEVFR